MKATMRFASGWTCFAIVTVLASWLLALPLQADAQNTCSGPPGQNGVYNPTCNNGNPGVVGSPAFIDATVFAQTNSNICKVLNGILSGTSTSYPATGAVIDARGLPFTRPSTSMTCTTANPSPWAGISSPPPSTILLPATTAAAPIVIPSTWNLPPNTHLIGEGDGIASSTTISTTIQAQSPNFSGSMIQFGPSATFCFPPEGASICNGISVENLTLDGQGQSINGITNQLAGDQSYVDHVSLYQILGTGLYVSSGATNSGPYSNITFDTEGDTSTTSTACAQILNAGSTHGIRGLSCTSESNIAQAAVLLDSSNNSLEDVRIVGFYDGIRVGANANAQGNVLVNIIGDTAKPICKPICVTPINVVHIFSVGNTVSDLSIMGLDNIGGLGTYSLWDDLTGAHLSDASVGIYAIGNKGTGNYYSRFTTSPNAASWIVGPKAPTVSCAQGSLYSCIGDSSGNGTNCGNNALWACAYNSSGSVVWQAVK